MSVFFQDQIVHIFLLLDWGSAQVQFAVAGEFRTEVVVDF